MEQRWVEAAERLHGIYPVVDAHCDTVLRWIQGESLVSAPSGQVDLGRLRQGGVRLVFCALFVERTYPPGSRLLRALQLLDRFWQEYERHPRDLLLIQSRGDLRDLGTDSRIGVLLTLEGGEALEEELAVLRQFYRLGLRGLGLTWNQRNALAGGVAEQRAPGLSDFGAEVLRELNRLGMVVDVAHLSERAFWEVMEMSRGPVVATHANVYRLCPHPRNLRDAQLKALASSGGVIGVTFVPGFVDRDAPSLDRLVDHLEYLCSLVGVEAVGLGSDFDGAEDRLPGLEDAGCLPRLTARLLARGFREEDVARVLGGNWLALLERVLP
ncbi:MAG: dipeptidase [Clostridia bacterium]|nr:dipeptidase [Clostridia bacterium]MDH7572928.1 dipeptidase [Clostridia bacterium]